MKRSKSCLGLSGRTARLLLPGLILALGQTACGGGGGGAAPPATPTATIAAAPATVAVGDTSTLTWSSTNATSCTATGTDPAWTGTQLTSGTLSIGGGLAVGSYTYNLTCTGANGTSQPATTSLTVAPPQLTVWTPDFGDSKVRTYVGDPATAPKPVTVDLPASCNPNSVVVRHPTSGGDLLYVACSASAPLPAGQTTPFPNGVDEILVYDAGAIRNSAPGTEFTPTPTLTIDDANIKDVPNPNAPTMGFYSGLVGMALDANGNLFVAAYNIGMVYEYPAGTQAGGLDSGTPSSTLVLQNSPSAPAGLVFDGDGILWVTGTAGGGPLLLGFEPAQLLPNGQNTPAYCMGVGQGNCDVATGEPGTPNDWEGVALFNGQIWVSNNDAPGANGATPGYYVYGFTVTQTGTAAAPGTLVYSDSIGSGTAAGVQCPGGLFGGVHLWINDEGFGDTNPAPTCGDPGDEVTNGGGGGGVFELGAGNLTAGPLSGYLTGRPGFGGLFVENDD
jgi:hypothetical protein